MTKKKTAKFSKIWLPIVLALIAACGVIVAAFIGSDSLKEILASFYPRPSNATFTVHIADNTGKSLQGAKVLFFYQAGTLSQYTDSNGVSTFSIADEVTGNVRLIVESDEYQIYEKQILYPIETTLDVRLRQKQGSYENVVLRTVREVDSEPVPGVEVIVSYNGQIVRQVSDSDGFAVYVLPFSLDGTLDVQISVNAQGYKIENQFGTLTPGKLQYILLTPTDLRVEIPNIPAPRSTDLTTEPASAEPDLDENTVMGSGVDISQQPGGRGLKVILLTPDSEPWESVFVELYDQKTDASGNPASGKRLQSGYINNLGEIDFEVPEGPYVVCPSERRGYGWTENECVYDIKVIPNSLTTVKLQGGQIEFAIVDANGKPWENIYFEVYTQKQDVNANPVTDDRVWSGYTANTGIANVWLTPGLYALSLDLRGYNWGGLTDRRGEVNIPVKRGEKTSLLVKMGKINVGLKNPDGGPQVNTYVEIYTEKADVNNKSVTASRVWSGYTDNGGFAMVDLTQGLYTVKIGDNALYNVPVNWGVITYTDGITYHQE